MHIDPGATPKNQVDPSADTETGYHLPLRLAGRHPKNQVDPSADTETSASSTTSTTAATAPKTKSIHQRILKPMFRLSLNACTIPQKPSRSISGY